ncbi:MAG TPA: aspartate aminotransferase family protein [Solirubrobacteraceae bacterium]|nr:aspartate aminotransferase family protein [Solirubrobacteraceae bacterium]
MATQPILDPTVLEAGRRALLARGTSGRGDEDIVLTRARGSLVWDVDGREYIDCTSQAWSNNLGANDPRVVEAAIEQLREITHIRPVYSSLPLFELSAKLVEIAPGGLDRVSYSLHGSTAVETAMKVSLRNRPAARNILVLQDAYHGRSLATLAASWPHPGDPFSPLQPRFTRVPAPNPYRPRIGLDPEADAALCLDLLRDTIRKGVDGGVAAVMMEPIQGNGGHIEFPRSWYAGVRQICEEEDVLLVLDEIQTGFGRLGAMWGSEYYDITPDILVFGKAVGGGFPLAGVLVAEHIQAFESGDDQLTFGEFPVSLAAGLATIKASEEDDVCTQSRDRGIHATKRLLDMQRRHPLIGDVRCPGLMVAIELVQDRETKAPSPAAAREIARRSAQRGVLFGESRYAGLGDIIKVKPPLDIPYEQLDQALDVLDEVIAELEGEGLR